LDVLLYKNPDFEGFEASERSEEMLGWIVLLMGMSEIVLLMGMSEIVLLMGMNEISEFITSQTGDKTHNTPTTHTTPSQDTHNTPTRHTTPSQDTQHPHKTHNTPTRHTTPPPTPY
jgi:hypothetical protein